MFASEEVLRFVFRGRATAWSWWAVEVVDVGTSKWAAGGKQGNLEAYSRCWVAMGSVFSTIAMLESDPI